MLSLILLGLVIFGLGSTPVYEPKVGKFMLGDLGKRMAEAGVIDREKFLSLYAHDAVLAKEAAYLLNADNTKALEITQTNAGLLLNFFWALGLGNKNEILEKGEMSNPRYGGAQNFASTGGWTLAKGNAMEHYSRHTFFNLTSQQQALVEKISGGIYRPCCGNSARFPDCNHGMAMLGLLELMASQDASAEEMWQTALTVNSFWFPDTYLTIATYMQDRGVNWEEVNPEEVLGINFSSAQGFARVAAQVTKPTERGAGKCSI
jgi:hypothetical protein